LYKHNNSKGFFHNFFALPDLETTQVDGKRHYITPAGVFPSVTTALSDKLSKQSLEEWRKRVGEEEANKISTQARNRGTAFHNICENYIMNRDYRVGAMPSNIDMFLQIKPHLDKNLSSIFGVEVPLWSDRLKLAGRSDLLAGWAGYNSVLDFKTSKYPKKEEHIESYFLQATCYSLMASERTLLRYPKIVIIIAVDHEEPQIFERNAVDYVERLLQVLK
jgi:genome maintenance exonuclease 1